MGILQSSTRSLVIETDDEEENVISLHDLNFLEKSEYARRENFLASPRQWQNGNRPTHSHQSKYLTISVPDLKGSSSLDYTSVKENGQPNVCGGERTNRTRGREEVPVMVKCRAAAAAEDRWIKHYSSGHRILLVGEGDFSFSTCLASAFGLASNMVATSLNSQGFLVKNYGSAFSNLVELSKRKCRVMHEIDATEMARHPLLGGIKFDRIIFNFPFAGFFKELPREAQLLRHRTLVSKFMENAKEMLSENGEIHVSHKTNGFFKEWRVECVGWFQGLRLVEEVEFSRDEYPGYNTKYGFGGDNNFNCNPSVTYKFRL